jgi:15-cis-phytoene synthase
MSDAFIYCEDQARAADKDRYLATLFAPADRRPHLFALIAFNLEIARVRELVREPLPGEVRLQWWRDAIEGRRGQEAAAHPVARALLDVLAQHHIPAMKLTDIIDARSFDLYRDPMPTVAALEDYVRRTSSALIELSMVILDGVDNASVAAAEQAGIAYAITGLLRTFALHASRQQLYVPLDLLHRHGASTTDIFAGRSSPQILSALTELRARVRSRLEAIQVPLRTISPTLLPALLPIALVPLYLQRMDRRDYEPFASAIEVPQWHRQWALWRTARRFAAIA